MNRQQIEDCFDRMGYLHFRNKFPYMLWISGILDDVDEDYFESFLHTFGLNDHPELLFDQFLSHFKIYKKIVKNEEG